MHPISRIIALDAEVRRQWPALLRAASEVRGPLLEPRVQRRLDARLARFTAWSDWVERVRRPLGLEPLCVRTHGALSAPMLVGLARALFPGRPLCPYDMGPAAVTEVVAQPGATERSHSQNDLPAPPHTAGFFETQPPRVAVFACIRPHPGGGAETTVTDVRRVLAALPERVRVELATRELHLLSPRRYGRPPQPFHTLTEVDGLPYLRFRMDYTVERTDALLALDELIRDDAHQYVAPLARGDVLFVNNGAPHGRRPQNGPTPADPNARRTLLRCRLDRLRSTQKSPGPRTRPGA